MTASVKTMLKSHGGSMLSKNGYGLYVDPFRGFGRGRVRFQFDDPTYDPRGNWYREGAEWYQVSSEPNIWDYWRDGTDWSFEFGDVMYSPGRIKSPCCILIANLEGVRDIGYICQVCTNIHDIYNFYAPDVTNVQHAFDTCVNLETCEILSLGSATSFYRLFGGCRSMEEAPVFDFPVEVTDVSEMFAGCTSLVNVPLYDTSHITNFGAYSMSMLGMFGGCTALQHVPEFDTSSAIDMDGMFYNCRSLLDCPVFDTSHVRDMTRMFGNCVALTNAPAFDTGSCIKFGGMFTGCINLTRVPLYDTSAMTADNESGNCGSMFSGCVSVAGGSLALYNQMSSSGWEPTYSSQYSSTFRNCGTNTLIGNLELSQIPSAWK